MRHIANAQAAAYSLDPLSEIKETNKPDIHVMYRKSIASAAWQHDHIVLTSMMASQPIHDICNKLSRIHWTLGFTQSPDLAPEAGMTMQFSYCAAIQRLPDHFSWRFLDKLARAIFSSEVCSSGRNITIGHAVIISDTAKNNPLECAKNIQTFGTCS